MSAVLRVNFADRAERPQDPPARLLRHSRGLRSPLGPSVTLSDLECLIRNGAAKFGQRLYGRVHSGSVG
jgi:hypothetical protein